jgi:anti-anti-sigma factor
MMTLIEEKNGHVYILDVSGDIDRDGARAFQDRAVKVLDAGEQLLLVDFTGVTYINSPGLSVLILIAKRLQISGGKLAMNGVNEPIQKVLKISGLLSLLNLSADRDAALAFLC